MLANCPACSTPGVVSYMNDNIVDGLTNLLKPQKGDFWIFPSHTYDKILMNERITRWTTKAMKKWEKKWGKGHGPQHILVGFAIALHYRLFVWDTNRDRVVYIDPLNPHADSPETVGWTRQ